MEKPAKIKQVDKYLINFDKILGSGAVSNVYVGWEVGKEETKFAIKQQTLSLLIKFLGQDDYLKYMKREASIMKTVQNENIVHIVAIKLTKESFYIIMEYCNGGNLRQQLNQKPNKRMPESEAKNIFKQIMNGYQAINKAGAIHRDIKPENILFRDGIAKIADFGLSRIIEQNDQLDQYVTKQGTPYYSPPQLLRSQGETDKNGDITNQVTLQYPQKIDIWSIGVLFYEVLVGKKPWRTFDEQPITDLLDQIENNDIEFPEHLQLSEQIKDLIFGMITIDEKYRFSFEECMNHPYFQN